MNTLYRRWSFNFLLLIFLLSISACATSSVDNEIINKQKPVPGSQYNASNFTNGLRPSDIELGLLSNLLGTWNVQDWQLRKDGQWQALNGARWSFSAIQNGRALQDNWVSFAPDGKTAAGHVNAIRVYDAITQKWQAAWLSSNDGRLEFFSGSEDMGEVIFTTTSANKGRLSRQVFSEINPQSFKWRIEWSKDGGESWLTVYRVEAIR